MTQRPSTHAYWCRVTNRLPPLAALALCVATALDPAAAQARNLALLVGIGHYHDPRIPQLEGPPNDVTALAALLTERWGFRPADIRTLIDAKATRTAILAGLDALATDSAPGDLTLFYFAGHGTSPLDPYAAGLPLPHGSGALTAWDTVPEIADDPQRTLGSLLVGRTDLKPRLVRLDRSGRHAVVLLDACYSANTTRGIYRSAIGAPSVGLPSRFLPLRPIPPLSLGPYGTGRLPPTPPYPYTQVLTLAASSAGEQAQEISATTLDRQPHGAFTDALLRVLSGQTPADLDGDGRLSYQELSSAIDRQMRGRGFPQRPQIFPTASEDTAHLSNRTLFDAPTAKDSPVGPRTVPDLALRLAPGAESLGETLGTLPGVTLISTPPDLVIAPDGTGWLLTNPGGDKVGTAADRSALTARVRQLAWLHRMTWRQAKNSFGLALAAADSSRGTVHYLGEAVRLEVRPERECWLVLLYIDSQGTVAALYPARPDETKPLAAGVKVGIPADDSLRVVEPLGTDSVVALAYASRPPFLDALVTQLAPMQGPVPLGLDSPLYRDLVDSLRDERSVAVAILELETMPAPSGN